MRDSSKTDNVTHKISFDHLEAYRYKTDYLLNNTDQFNSEELSHKSSKKSSLLFKNSDFRSDLLTELNTKLKSNFSALKDYHSQYNRKGNEIFKNANEHYTNNFEKLHFDMPKRYVSKKQYYAKELQLMEHNYIASPYDNDGFRTCITERDAYKIMPNRYGSSKSTVS